MTLLLDPDIRDWVVLPLFVIIVIAGLLRQVVSGYMQGAKTPVPPLVSRTMSVLKHSRQIAGPASHYVSTARFAARKQHAVDLLRAEADWLEEESNSSEGGAADPMEALMSNPMGMLGGNMVFMVQNMVMMQGIQHFFSGFILLRVPFSLTAGFKNMFQRGLADLPDLEPSYVSSVSWYFLVLYGLRSFFKLVQGMPAQEVREQERYLQQIGLQAPPNPAAKGQDPETMAKQLRTEADNLELFLQQHKSDFDSVEKRLLGKKRYPKKKISHAASADFLVSTKKKGGKKRQ